MREMVEYIVKQIVDNPEEVKVQEIKAEKIILLEISVAKEDMGKVIGKGGRVANALRTLVGAAAAKLKKRVMVEILEE
ncbi:KH domain-containing protein [Candidatus Aerophobetes bacterium]|uniref:RNA-binding protein KhpA n=1 Tax=Aerophobetes bacterium TaxID=2030807 RepID=A0A523QKL5_UNCAE|nr:MAG: KH domain-containing protein [Candidatus Aerophobetes bacterium]